LGRGVVEVVAQRPSRRPRRREWPVFLGGQHEAEKEPLGGRKDV
jgi:hypothetical protein